MPRCTGDRASTEHITALVATHMQAVNAELNATYGDDADVALCYAAAVAVDIALRSNGNLEWQRDTFEGCFNGAASSTTVLTTAPTCRSTGGTPATFGTFGYCGTERMGIISRMPVIVNQVVGMD